LSIIESPTAHPSLREFGGIEKGYLGWKMVFYYTFWYNIPQLRVLHVKKK
jgi:hypothetical protein